MFLTPQTISRIRYAHSAFSSRFRNAQKAAFILVVASWSAGSLNAQSPTLIQDLYPGNEPSVSFTHRSVALGSVALFSGPGLGPEPWVTDGTTLGTVELRDIFPGPDAGLGSLESAVINGSVLFSADDGVRGAELWISDGTAVGTVLLKEIFPGPGDGRPRGFYSDGNNVYFTANDGVAGAALWISDGTAAGTQQLVDLAASTNPFLVIASDFASNGTLVFFRGFSEGDGYELFATDGTTAGTYQVADIQIGAGSSPSNLVALGSTVLFSAADGINGIELWKSDGTAVGTVRVAEINPTGNAIPVPMGIVNGNLLFSADDGVNGRELWKTNGSIATVLTSVSGSVGTEGAVLDGRLLFAASDGSDGLELWRSNGQPGGTGLVSDIQVGAGSGNPKDFLTVGNRVVFSADDGTNGREPWVTNGISAQLIADLDNGPDHSLHGGSFSPNAILTGDRLLFSAGASSEPDLWVTDGTAVGTVKLTDEQTPRSSTPRAITAWNDGIAFLAKFDEDRHDLYESDGTLPGTNAANILSPTVADENEVGGMIEVGGTLFLLNQDDSISPSQVDLWMWDGTTGTEVASDFATFLPSGPKHLTAADSTLVFSHANSLHRNDGAAVGDATNGIIPGVPTQCSGQADELIALGSRVVYAGVDAGDCELWVVDLADNTATLLKDFDPIASSTPDIVGVFGGEAVLLLREGASMGELWTTDGTVAGTQAVGASIPFGFVIQGGAASTAFFLASYDAMDEASKIWKTDGSAAGTSLLLSLPLSEGLFFLGAVNAGAYFQSQSGVWFSDGTVSGTTLVAPGVQHVQAARTHGDDLVFAATLTAGEGREFFRAQGASGTFEALPDLEPGLAGTAITDALVVGDTLYLSAFRKDVGTELFELDLSQSPTGNIFGDGFESGDTGAWTAVSP